MFDVRADAERAADAERSVRVRIVACGCGQRTIDFYLLARRSVEYEPGFRVSRNINAAYEANHSIVSFICKENCEYQNKMCHKF